MVAQFLGRVYEHTLKITTYLIPWGQIIAGKEELPSSITIDQKKPFNQEQETTRVEDDYLQILIALLQEGEIYVESAKEITREFLELTPFTTAEDLRSKIKHFTEIHPEFAELYSRLIQREKEKANLTVEAIQYYSCFISYSTKDQAFADKLYADLQSQGVRCWFAPEDIMGGRKLYEQIPEAIRLYDKLLLVLSEHSMASEWVKTEIHHARQDEIRDNKRKLFPIGLVDFTTIRHWEAFDANIGKDMAREVREYFIPDFSNWKDHDAYKKAFDRLLRDLKASELEGKEET